MVKNSKEYNRTMTAEQILWQACAKQLGLDGTDHEDDEDIEPLYDLAVKEGKLEELRSRM